MLNPLELNYLAHKHLDDRNRQLLRREFPLPWHPSEEAAKNGAFENIRGAWEYDREGVELPVAVYPTYVHPRLRGQRACFTIHGKRKEGLNHIAPQSVLKQYQLDPEFCDSMLKDLQILGITDTVAFPDLDGLASELKHQFS